MTKVIEGFSRYTIDEFGNVYDTIKNRYMEHKIDKHGYNTVGIWNDEHVRKFKLVSRLILETFNPVNNQSELQVNHKDENKDNNSLYNLEWITPKDNCNYGTRNQKCKEAVIKPIICIETGDVYESAREAERMTGVNYGCVSMVCNGKHKHAGGFTWRFI